MEFGERYRQIDLFRLASVFTFKTYLQRCHYKNQGCNVAFFSSTPFLYSLLLLFFLSFSFVSVILSLQQAKKGIWLFSTKTGANFVRFVSGIVGTEFTLF